MDPLDNRKKPFTNELRFIREWIREPGAVGAIAATGKYAARAMASHVSVESSLPVLELGPGTGSITKAILERGVAPEKLVSIEYSREFYDYLTNRFAGVNFINGDALDLKTTLAGTRWGKFSAIVSAVPLLNLPRPARANLIAGGLEMCEPGAPFVQITYGPKPPVPPDKDRFAVDSSELVVRNVPPAWIFVYRSVRSN